MSPTPRWHQDLSRDPRMMSALAWGIANGHTSTAQYAAKVARSMGKLPSYMLDVNFYQGLLPDACRPWRNRWEKLRDALLDPLSLAIVMGDTQMVETLTRGADILLLSSVWPDSDIKLSHEASTFMTPLHVAIWMEQYDIAEVLLQRFTECDQSTLKWFEPVGLGFASYLGCVKMARLMLEGEKGAVPESPWAARIRSQLVDPRAYSRRVGIRRRHRYDIDMFAPPMILASLGSGQTFHPPGGEGIFALLAAQDPHLATKKCNYLPYGSLQRPWYGASQTPLEVAVTYSKYLLPSAEPCILALIRAGALEPCRLRSSGNLAQSYRELLSHLLTAELKWKNRRRFLEQCWDAALEHHGGTADDEFVTSWDEGIGNALPIKPISNVAKTPQDRKNIVWELTLILEIISLLDRRSPGFAQQPNIRRYLDHCVFQRRNRYAFNYADLVGDWSHLMAP